MIKKFYEFNESLGSDNLDLVLNKMNREGFQSLNKREKLLLQKFTKGEDITNFSLEEPEVPVRMVVPTVIRAPREYGNMRDNEIETSNSGGFQIGDIVVLYDKERGKLPENVYRYIIKKDEFLISGINDSGKLDVGAKTQSGKIYYLSSKRFLLQERKPKITSAVDPLGEEDWGATVS